MSEVLSSAIAYIDQSKVGLLVTIGEDGVPYVRDIGAFSNESSDIYFFTAKATQKVKHIALNPKVTIYFENEGQQYESFKSVAVSGIASEVTEENEFSKAVEGISKRYPVIKDLVLSGEIKNTSIYKIKASFVKLADYTKAPKEVIEEV